MAMSTQAKSIVDAALLVINNLDEIYGAEDEQDYVLAMDALIFELTTRRDNAQCAIDEK